MYLNVAPVDAVRLQAVPEALWPPSEEDEIGKNSRHVLHPNKPSTSHPSLRSSTHLSEKCEKCGVTCDML